MQNQFKKVSRPEVDFILTHGHFQKSQLTMSLSKIQKVIKIKLATIAQDKTKRVYVLPQEVEELKDKLCAFSFKIGTQMYFFKSKIKFNNYGFFVDVPRESMYELARRQHIRFEGHPEFPISCSAVVSNDGKVRVPGQLLNISITGASLSFGDDASFFKKNGSVYVFLRPENSGGFSVEANVRFVKKKNGMATEVGLEFRNLDSLQINRVNSICEKLSFYTFAR